MSGTAASHGAIDNKPVSRAQEIAEMQGCPTVNLITMIKCLKSIPGENIIKVSISCFQHFKVGFAGTKQLCHIFKTRL